jgi:hypothetical protein
VITTWMIIGSSAQELHSFFAIDKHDGLASQRPMVERRARLAGRPPPPRLKAYR